MRIIRYSLYGFESQYQSYHMHTYVDYHLNRFDISIYPEHLKQDALEAHKKSVKFYKREYKNLRNGVWAFIEGYKRNLMLNHLKRRVPCWEAEIPDNAIVIVDLNCVPITANECKLGGFFIPKNQLTTLRNIRKLKRRK